MASLSGLNLDTLFPTGALDGKLARPSNQIDSLDEWFASLTRTGALVELTVLVGCALQAYLMVRLLRRATDRTDSSSIFFGRRIIDGVLFPMLLLSLAYAAELVLVRLFTLALFKVAIPATSCRCARQSAMRYA